MLHAQQVALSFVGFFQGEYKFYIYSFTYLLFSWILLENILFVLIPIPRKSTAFGTWQNIIGLERIKQKHFNFFSDKGKRFPCPFTEYIDESGEGNKTSIQSVQSQ